MSKQKIAIFGASGFVGSALVERLFFGGGHEVKALIHSFGNAARIARLPIQLQPVDVLDLHQVNEVLCDCSIVVNCSRGSNAAMIRGLRNIIKASRQNKVEKFIHIGSIAIYGDNPATDSGVETAVPDPGINLYGAMKLKQDQMVFGLHASGVPSIILCPSNISGPYSVFVQNAVERLLSNDIVLVDEGIYPTNLIHVDNLVEAILAAIKSDKGWGERYFINEVEKTTWREFFEELKQMLGLAIEFKSVSRDEVLHKLEMKKNDNTISHNARLLLSRDVRSALTVLPALKKVEAAASNVFFGLKPGTQKKLRRILSGPITIAKETNKIDIENPFTKVQVRQVFHSPKKIMTELNYSPLLDYQERYETTRSWLSFINFAAR